MDIYTFWTKDNIMLTETSYQDYVKTLFEEIEAELIDLTKLIEIECYENPNRYKKLIQFKNKCVERYNEFQNIDFEELEGDDPNTIYTCAEISTDIYDLIKKLRNDRPEY